MRWALLALLPVAACSSGGTPALCETKIALVDHTAWSALGDGDDPFDPPAGSDGDAGPRRGRCAGAMMMPEPLNEEPSFTMDTNQCAYGTVTQPALAAVAAGEMLTIRVWYFSQTKSEPAVADVEVAFGDTPIWMRAVPLPVVSGGLLIDHFAAPSALAAGAPIRWHVSNHGTNTWNIVEVSVTRKVPCREVGS